MDMIIFVLKRESIFFMYFLSSVSLFFERSFLIQAQIAYSGQYFNDRIMGFTTEIHMKIRMFYVDDFF